MFRAFSRMMFTVCLLFATAAHAQLFLPVGPLSLDSSNEWLQQAFDDKISDNVKLIGLGEFTHGGHEVFMLKAKVVQYLIEKKGVRDILFEYPNAALSLVNFYLKQTRLKSEDTLKWICIQQFGNSIMDNSLLDLLTWVKRYNLAHPDDMVSLKGVDISGASGSFANYFRNNFFQLLDTVTQNKLNNEWNTVSIDSISKELISWHNDHKDSVQQRLKIYYSDFLYNVKNAESDIAWRASKNQFLQSLYQRDSIIADNIQLLLEKKAIFWAHNGHVVAENYYVNAGNRVKKALNSSYYVIATDFSEKATIMLPSGKNKAFSPHKQDVAHQLARSIGADGNIVFYSQLSSKIRIASIGIEGIYQSFVSKNGFDALIILKTVTPALLK